jgi:hypothetical protein
MLNNIPPEITIGSFSLIGILTGYIWNNQNNKIKEIKNIQEQRPCTSVCGQINSIKNDINWIKKILDEKL